LFTFGLAIESIKELGGVSHYMIRKVSDDEGKYLLAWSKLHEV
jgi:hypothetical protein